MDLLEIAGTFYFGLKAFDDMCKVALAVLKGVMDGWRAAKERREDAG